MAQHPIVLLELLDLPALGINPEAVKFGSTTMESDKFIVTCETVGDQQNVVMVDLQAGNAVTRRPISAEAAIMNPVSKVLALRAGTQLQIFNLELRAKMKSYQTPDPIIFWRWVTPNTIALVTQNGVYHWSIEGDAPPVKLEKFDVFPEGTQVISYKLSGDGKWALLVGISAGANGVIDGRIHLYSIEKSRYQQLQGHAGCFATIKVPGRADPAQVLIFEEKKAEQPAKLFVMEVGRDKDAPGGVFRLQPQLIQFPAEAPNDFPVSMTSAPGQDIIFMITRMGYLFLFDIPTGKTIYRTPNRIAKDTVFATATQDASSGVLGITARSGKVLQMNINEQTIVPYIVQVLRDNQLAIDVSRRLNLPGARDLYVAEFNKLLAQGDAAGAARLAAESPQGILRTQETVDRFKQIPAMAGAPQPIFQYFSILLEVGPLNKTESLQLVELASGRTQLIEKWLTEDKLEASEELGDLLYPIDANLALSVYIRANVPEKAINCFLQRGEFDKIVAYAQKVGYRADYTHLLQNLVRAHPQGAVDFAKRLVANEQGPLIETQAVVDIFMSLNRVQETTAFLLEALKGNKREEGHLQTKLLEIILLSGNPQFAEAILQNEMFSHYDRPVVAKLCEQAGLFQRALEHYTNLADIKRIMGKGGAALSPDFLLAFFGKLNKDTTLECLNDLLGANLRQNLQLVVQVATKYSEQLGAEPLVKLFEKFKSFEGLYYYLSAIVNTSQEPLVHFKYIEAAAKLGQLKEVERVCRDSTVYNPQEVKAFLMEAKLPDPKPLIYVCDRHGFIEEMTGYLYTNNLKKYIEVYVQKVSPAKTPQVVGKLLDLDCNEDFVRMLLQSIGIACPVEELVEQVERRNRLRIAQPWLESLVATGNTETATHNAIGKIYITLNRDPVNFLKNNQFYDPLVLGKFCEKLDPSLAFLAYRRGGGACDDDLIRVTNENGLFKDQARYLIEKRDGELWAKVLSEENQHRRALIDQVVQTALPETETAEQVSETVKAFMAADLSVELIELLERIVLHGSKFSNTRSLQNLLILTAIKSEKERVQDYINRLDNFDGPEIAKIAASEQYELYEEAFAIYVKFAKAAKNAEERGSLNRAACEVLVDNLRALDRAKAFAERINEPEVWSKLAKAQLDDDNVHEAVNSYIKASDPAHYSDVIAVAQRYGAFEDLVRYLKMVRKQVKEPLVDTEYIYSLAKTGKLPELEEFIAAPNVANIQSIGERLFEEGNYEAAKLLFNNINNNSKLALCFINLNQYREAVDAAQKANSISTWKEVNVACVKVGEFRLAAICGSHIIVHPDHLEELIQHYERTGHPTELMQLLEQGLGLEGAHSGVFTELGILYSKYLPEKLMEHLKIFHNRMNVPKMLRACEKALLWDETVYLYKEDGQPDNAVKTMIEHPVAFHHELFLDCIQKARNQEVYYRAIAFYLEQQPMLLERLLSLLTPNLDHARVVHQLRRAENLPLVLPYLKSVQKENISVVNEALNELYIDDEDYTALRESIDSHDNFDQIALAVKIENHELLEFRRLAAALYKKNKRWAQSVSLSKADKMYKDAIDTAAQSGEADLVEDLLRFFVSVQDRECFAAVLFTCYELIRPDVALELAWRNNYYDFFMPYIIQYLRHAHERIKALEARTASLDVAHKEAESSAAAAVGDAAVSLGLYGNHLMLTDGGPALLANEAFNPMTGYEHHGMGGGGGGGGGYGAGGASGFGIAPPPQGYGQQQQQQQQVPYPPQGGFQGGFGPQGGYGGSW